MWEKPSFDRLQKALDDPSTPIGMRMRAAYFLRQYHAEVEQNEVEPIKGRRQQEVIDVLSKGLLDPRHGSLMRHEIAYVMGQIRDERSCNTLELILDDDHDCIMVRHEAAEALAAIGASRSEIVLQMVLERSRSSIRELHETCQVALDVMEWRASGSNIDTMPAICACMLSPYSSVDPAPPHPSHSALSVDEIGDILVNDSMPIFERYRAMFSLRNIGDSESVHLLCAALLHDKTSVLLRHEVAYVLGQLQHPDSVGALEQSLRRVDEHTMVRHESAEALGAMEGRWEDVKRILSEFSIDEDEVVRESCLVALDAGDYWGYSGSPDVLSGSEILRSGNSEVEPGKFALQKAESGVLVNHFNLKQ
jgi:deoxyhypusine monooxygenase